MDSSWEKNERRSWWNEKDEAMAVRNLEEDRNWGQRGGNSRNQFVRISKLTITFFRKFWHLSTICVADSALEIVFYSWLSTCIIKADVHPFDLLRMATKIVKVVQKRKGRPKSVVESENIDSVQKLIIVFSLRLLKIDCQNWINSLREKLFEETFV